MNDTATVTRLWVLVAADGTELDRLTATRRDAVRAANRAGATAWLASVRARLTT